MSDSEERRVLVVDDDRALAAAYATWLTDRFAVGTATSGEEAIAELDGGVDVVLLDRRLPGRSGDEVLESIRERDGDFQVAMVTAVTPDVDIVDLGFDEYLVKPVTREALLASVESLFDRAEYDERVQTLFALVSKRATLLSDHEGREDDQLEAALAELDDRIVTLREQLDETLAQFEYEDFEVAFRDLEADADSADADSDGDVDGEDD